MYFVLPIFAVLGIYLLAAVLPAAFLMSYVYRHDSIEKEPPELLTALALSGVVAALAAIALESVGTGILAALVDEGSPAYTVLLAFLVVAVAEEGTKFFFLRRRTWRDPNFNYRFDGIVYAVFVSLGFAAIENLMYVFGYGLSVALPRAMLAIPGHLGFAVFMGLFYGRAKLYDNYGNTPKRNLNLWAGYLSAVFLHGVYDTCAMIGSVLSTGVFLVFMAAMYLAVIRLLRRESETDRHI